MMAIRTEWTDERVESTMGTLLRSGVLLATVLVAGGAVLFLARHHGEHPNYRVFRGEPAELRGVVGIVEDALRPSGRGIIQLGLVALIATPVARVVFSLAVFVIQRDKVFVLVTLTVLLLLLYSLFWASA
jgi:uncharacterized membrane protein